jgi:hypothetical protein
VPNQSNVNRFPSRTVYVYQKIAPNEDTDGGLGNAPARRRRRRSLRSDRPRRPAPHHRPDGATAARSRRHLPAAPLQHKTSARSVRLAQPRAV